MTVKQIIGTALDFLCRQYGMQYSYEEIDNGGEYFKFYNEYGCFIYYQWEQFQEKEFSVLYNQCSQTIDLTLLYPKEFASFKRKHKGIKWLFKDERKDYWDMIAEILKKEIERTDCLFGIKLTYIP